ncbi:MAG: DUF362 domain-containing protein [Thermodesulfobacteriota bacterium]|jgi:uncharacterized protein (DUF362 family)
MDKSIVAVLKTKPETVFDDIRRLCELADLKKHLDPARPVILKDNISWHFPFLSANTTPWQLEGIILALKESGYKDLVAVHNKTVVTNPDKGGRLNKLTPIYQKYQIPELYNFRKDQIRWVAYQPKAPMKALNGIFTQGIYIPEFFIGKNIVHLPTVKTHIYTSTTGAMKNAFGGLLNTKRHYTHSVIHETLVDLLAIQKEIHSGIFALMDGTVCGSGPGPRTMTPMEKDFMLASGDTVAIDALAARMMGFDPLTLLFIRLAQEEGLGQGRFEEIEVLGEDVSKENFGFQVGDNFASNIGDFLWFSPFRKYQKLFFRTPLVYLFIFGSFFYHDFIWWPFKGKSLMRKLKKESKWGRYFSTYPDLP